MMLLGYLLVGLGVATADSELLIIPTMLMALGVTLLILYQVKEGVDNE